MKTRPIGWLSLFLSVSFSASANYYTGDDVYEWAQAYERIKNKTPEEFDFQSFGAYRGYIAAVIDLDRERTICLPSGARISGPLDVISTFYKNNPASRPRSAAEIIRAVLAADYPCS